MNEKQACRRIVVMGAGGMGALFGSIVQQGGLEVTLIDVHDEHVAAIQRNGLQVIGFGGDRIVPMAATTQASEVHEADVVFFQCKSMSSKEAAQSVAHLMEGGAVALSFQNGLGNEEVIASVVGGDKVLGGLTTMAGAVVSPGVVRDFSRTPSYIGELAGGMSQRTKDIADSLTAAGLETHAEDNIKRRIWTKLLANIATSALSGATDLAGVDVLGVPELKAVSENAMKEALAVSDAAGIGLDPVEVKQTLAEIARPGGTGQNPSSLCMDIRNQRPTEVDFIYGTVAQLGREHHVETPTLNTLIGIVKGIESRYLTD